MKFTINKKEIVAVLGKLQGLASRKTNLTITENVLIRSVGSQLSIAATDLETGFEGFYPAEVEAEGLVTLNAKKLFEIVRNFPTESIFFNEVDNRWMKIGNDQVEFNIVGSNPDDFPDIPRIDDDGFFNIESLELKKMIEKTIMVGGITGEEKRAHILGVMMENIKTEDKTVLRIVATDGKRLSMIDYPSLEQEPVFVPGEGIIIPKKGLAEVVKFLDSEGMLKIGVKDNNFIVKKENETLIISLLDGIFPKFNELMSVEDKHHIELDKQDYKMMLKRMSILTTDDYKGAIFKFSDKKLLITAANPDFGESKEGMDIDFKSADTEIAFNPFFFIDALNHIDENKVVVHIKDDETPCIINGKENERFINIIMPMKL
jgi:DNA polymerase-3 subunit beta